MKKKVQLLLDEEVVNSPPRGEYIISHTPRLIVQRNIKVYKILLLTLPPRLFSL